jgi:hypothetical protein
MVSTLLPPGDSTRIIPAVKRGLRAEFHRLARLFRSALA